MGFGMTVVEFTVVDTCSSRRYLVVSTASTSLTHNILFSSIPTLHKPIWVAPFKDFNMS
jgi:hypothetical protein